MNSTNMKFSYYFGSRERVMAREYDSLFEFLKTNGYEAVELLEMYNGEQIFNSEAEVLEFARLLKLNGIASSCYSVYMDIYDKKIGSAEEYLKKQVDIASILGSPYLHHTLKPELEKTSDLINIDDLLSVGMPILKNVADYAKSKGITLLYEPQGMYFNGAGLKKLIDTFAKMGVENVGVCSDFGNSMFVDYAPYEIISEMMQYVRHVHIKDYKLCPDGEGDYRSSGGQCFYEVEYAKGDMKNRECIEALLDAGYNGYFSTELNPRGMTSDDAGVDALKRIRKDFL